MWGQIRRADLTTLPLHLVRQRPPASRYRDGVPQRNGETEYRLTNTPKAAVPVRGSGRWVRLRSAAIKQTRSVGCDGSVERVTAGAGVLRVGVVDREALLLDRVDEVDDRSVQVGLRHPVDGKPDPVETHQRVTVQGAVIEE